MTVVATPESCWSGSTVEFSGGEGSAAAEEVLQWRPKLGKSSARQSYRDEEGDQRTTVDGGACWRRWRSEVVKKLESGGYRGGSSRGLEGKASWW